jgi:hypothetical protein
MGSLLTQAVLDPLRDGILPADTCAVIALDTPFTARSKPRPSSTQDKGPRTAPPPVPQIEVGVALLQGSSELGELRLMV